MPPRPEIVGDDEGPTAPFPLRMGGVVTKGFGRGGRELGIPTANLPVEHTPWLEKAESGVYFGWAGLQLPSDHPALQLSDDPDAEAVSSTTFPTSVAYPSPLTSSSQEKAGEEGGQWRVYPMVMSIGFNPFYGNTVRSAEVHVMHGFARDFYGCEMRVSVAGFIRPELDYESKEKLVEDIKTDIEVTSRSLAREGWAGKEAGVDGYLWGEDAPSS